ncbi:serine protease nudel-like [Portunus trituberculatus]|uniref:serine protease nudel-like n=1 Tax=Portunus trituberculatus TaxID=210409 RepID=UPI001E1D1F76|nr:serine protease nudel-like [Portunus trituberculatus]
MGKKEAWILILVIMPVFSRWWGVRGMGSPSSFVPSSSSNSFGVFFSPSSSFIPSSIHDSYVISSISSSCLVDCCESTTSVSFSPILNPPSSFSPTPVYSTSHSASLSSLSFTSNSFSLSLSSSSNEDDHLIRRKRDFGYFKRYIEGMEKCDRTGWGYWWEESCDNIAHCPDLKDETLCSCDMMVPLEYICDGYLDCPDLTDERGCKGCNRDELSCVAREGEEQVCVRPWQLCDGVAQCFDGEDEAFCWRLESTPEDVKGYVSFRSSGYLQVKREQEWRPVCLDADHNPVPLVTYFCDLVVGDRYNKDVHKVEAVNKSGHVSTTKWARYEDMGVQVEVADSCEGGHVLEITCGEPGCFAGEGRVNIADKQDKRVVGGGDASPFQWPFIVAILKNSVYSCGGTIVTSSAILTAAHCIDEGPASYYEIQAGMLRRNSWSPFEQSRKVSQILPHPSYTGLSNDVALFLLEAPLHLNRWVRPVCLSEALYPKMDQICTVAGWGTLQEGGDTPKKLQELDLPVLSTCLADTHLSDEQVLCAGYPEGKMDACQGDSGGPLMCGNEENGTWEQVGVVSFGEGCARAGNAGVYARVTYFSTWIIKTAETTNS